MPQNEHGHIGKDAIKASDDTLVVLSKDTPLKK